MIEGADLEKTNLISDLADHLITTSQFYKFNSFC